MHTSAAKPGPFPTYPRPHMAPQTAVLMCWCLHPHLIVSSFSCDLFQNILFRLIYISAVNWDLRVEWLLHLLLFHVHHIADKGTWACSLVGFFYPEACGSSNICRTDSSLECFSAELHKLCGVSGLRGESPCSEWGLPAPCIRVVWTGGEIC